MEIRKAEQEESLEEGKYKGRKERTVFLSDYHIESEYSTSTEYKTKSNYEVQLVILDDTNLSLSEQLPIMNPALTTTTCTATFC